MQRIGGDDTAFQDQAFQHIQRGGDLVAPFGAARRNRQPRLGIPHTDHQRRHEGATPLVAAAQALAVDGDNAPRRAQPQCRPQRLSKAGERRGQFRRVEQPEQPAEAVVARRAMRQLDNLAKHLRIRLAKVGNIDRTLRPTQRRRQRDEQHRTHQMPRIDVPRVANFSENTDQCFHRRSLHQKRPSSESNFASHAMDLYSYAIPLP